MMSLQQDEPAGVAQDCLTICMKQGIQGDHGQDVSDHLHEAGQTRTTSSLWRRCRHAGRLAEPMATEHVGRTMQHRRLDRQEQQVEESDDLDCYGLDG